MVIYPLLAVSFIMNVVMVLFILCALALILIILVQKGRGGGLSAAFGGGMAGGLLGSKTGDFLTWVTIILVSIFLTLAVVMAKFYKEPVGSGFGTEEPKIPTAPIEQPKTTQTPAPPVVTTEANEVADVNIFGG
jgi:preprotein translocase subunit SecG